MAATAKGKRVPGQGAKPPAKASRPFLRSHHSEAQRVMATVIRQVIGRMEHPQLISVCSSIRQFMK